MDSLLIAIGKLVSFASKLLGRGNGSTWPGHIAININKNFIKNILKKNKQLNVILIAGTNGKTTTGKLIETILEKEGKLVFQNESGANLLSGIASSLLLHANFNGKLNYDFVIFEVDENSLPQVLTQLTPSFLIVLNLFRDQLDRYGEVNTIAKNWRDAFKRLTKSTALVLNADDPQVAYLGTNIEAETKYFGLDDKNLTIEKTDHASDSTYCPSCQTKLTYSKVFFSHLGEYKCEKCHFERPKLDISKTTSYPLSGIYNRYNTLAAVLISQLLKVSPDITDSALQNFQPAFGRQETIVASNRTFKIFLSKNPTSFNQSLRTIMEQKPKTILFVLNDRTPDGKDVSWIWDTDFEHYDFNNINLIVSGDRAYDMSLRIKYSFPKYETPSIRQTQDLRNKKYKIEEDLKDAINFCIEQTNKSETIYVLPTYSAMLEVRKTLTGKKIL